MRVKVKFFAVYREIAGRSEEWLELEEEATVLDALEVIFRKYPKIASLTDSIATSVNRSYSTEATVLREGDEMALLPPVSGG